VVTVTVQNNTGQAITKLSLAYRSSRSLESINLPELSTGAATFARFYVDGEGSYTLSVTLADGTELKPHEGYVESGYTVKDVLTARGVETTSQYRAAAR
jgi:hypothetical protein